MLNGDSLDDNTRSVFALYFAILAYDEELLPQDGSPLLVCFYKANPWFVALGGSNLSHTSSLATQAGSSLLPSNRAVELLTGGAGLFAAGATDPNQLQAARSLYQRASALYHTVTGHA